MARPERPLTPRKRYRCKYCGATLLAWLEVFQAPDGAMLLSHLSAMHPTEVGQYLARMTSDDVHDEVVVEAYELVEG
jgi:hypothetical protein